MENNMEKKMENNNKEFYDYFYKRESNSSTKSGAAKWEFYLVKSILKYAKKSEVDTIVDVGCGQGNKSIILSKHFDTAKVFALDPSTAGIESAKSMYGDYKNIDFINLSLDDFIIKNTTNSNGGGYNMVSALEVLEHLEDWQAVLSSMCEVSNKYILLSFPTGRMREYEKNVGHLRNFKRGEVQNFMNEKNYRTVKTFYSGFPFFTPLARNYIDKNYSNFMESIEHKFTKRQELFHNLVYISFRYFSFHNIGDYFTGLFEKK